jgi:hypothetical protein
MQTYTGVYSDDVASDTFYSQRLVNVMCRYSLAMLCTNLFISQNKSHCHYSLRH